MKTIRDEHCRAMLNNFLMMLPFVEDRIKDCWVSGDREITVLTYDGKVFKYDDVAKCCSAYKTLEDMMRPPANEDEWRRKFSFKLYRTMMAKLKSQEDLAYESGLSQSVISKYMNGKSTPSVYKLQKIADALGCSVSDLLNL